MILMRAWHSLRNFWVSFQTRPKRTPSSSNKTISKGIDLLTQELMKENNWRESKARKVAQERYATAIRDKLPKK